VDVGKEASAVLDRHVFVEKLGGTLDGGERAFHFVGEGADVLLGVLAAFEGLTHGFQGMGEGVDFAAGTEFGRNGAFALLDGAGVFGEFADGAVLPDENGEDEEQDAATDEPGAGPDFELATPDDGENVGLGFVG